MKQKVKKGYQIKIICCLCFIILTMVFPVQLFAVNYYFSSKGKDSNSGTKQAEPWLSLEKLQGITLFPGDSILLKSRDIFIGEIIIRDSGLKENPIVISTYDGNKNGFAIVTGATSVNQWQASSANPEIFSRKINLPVKQLYVDGKLMTLARFPNGEGMLTTSEKLPKGQIKTNELEQPAGFWEGATLRIHSIDWAWEVATVKKYSNNTLYITDSVRYQAEAGSRFFLENKRELLDYRGEWFYSHENQELLFFPENKNLLNSSNFKAVIFCCGILLESGVSNIKVENVKFDKFSDFGIYASGRNSGITIQNCTFENIGKTGVKFNRKSNDIEVEGNYFRNILGRGISFTECWNVSIKNNSVKKIGLIPGQGASGTNSYIGIIAELRDETFDRKYDYFDTVAHNISVTHNFIDSCGYIGLRLDGQYNLAEKNIIDHSMLHMNDGGGLYCFNEFTRSGIISNNFVYRSSSNGSISNGIYIDNLVYDMQISRNTLVDNAGSGVVINAAARDNFVHENILYGNGNGVCFSDWKETPITGNRVIGNVIVSRKATDPAVLLKSNYYRYNMAVYDSNYYVNPYSANLFKYEWSVKKFIGIEQWKSEFPSNDIHSKAVVNFSKDSQNSTVLFTNKTDTIRAVNLKDFKFYDLDFNPVNQLFLEPFSSKVLISPDFIDGTTVLADPPVIISNQQFLPRNFDKDIFAGSEILPETEIKTGMRNSKSRDSALQVFPNPVVVGQVLNIITNDFPGYYELYSFLGTKINTSKKYFSDKIHILIPEIPAGTYLVLNKKNKYAGFAKIQVIR